MFGLEFEILATAGGHAAATGTGRFRARRVGGRSGCQRWSWALHAILDAERCRTRLPRGESSAGDGNADVREEIDDGVFQVIQLGFGAFSPFAPYDVAEAVDQCDADNNEKRPWRGSKGRFCSPS